MSIQQIVKGVVDAKFDFEVISTPSTPLIGNCGSSGDNIILTPTTGKKIRVYWVGFQPSSVLSGLTTFYIGSTAIFQYNNASTAMHGSNLSLKGVIGGVDDVLKINLPSATTVYYNVYYEEE